MTVGSIDRFAIFYSLYTVSLSKPMVLYVVLIAPIKVLDMEMILLCPIVEKVKLIMKILVS